MGNFRSSGFAQRLLTSPPALPLQTSLFPHRLEESPGRGSTTGRGKSRGSRSHFPAFPRDVVQPEPVARIDPRGPLGSRRSSRCSPCAPLSASRLHRPRSYTPAESWRSSRAPHWPLTVTGCERSCAHSTGSEHLRAPDLSAQDVPLSVVGGLAQVRRSDRSRGQLGQRYASTFGVSRNGISDRALFVNRVFP